jgi:hypothetical protein
MGRFVPAAPGQSRAHHVNPSSGSKLILRLEDSAGNHLANSGYSISWNPSNASSTGRTDGDGVVREVAPSGATGATITLDGTVNGMDNAGPKWSVDVTIMSFTVPTTGIVDPNAPIAARLSNLGFLSSLGLDDALDQYREYKGIPSNPPPGMTRDNLNEYIKNQLVSEHDT